MRKTTLLFAAISIVVTGFSPAIADEMPPGMQMPKPKPKVTHHHHKSGHAMCGSNGQMQGMNHGCGQMHKKMPPDHNMGMPQGQQPQAGGMAPQGGQAPMPMSSATKKPMGCC
jgi:hypothetical protein